MPASGCSRHLHAAAVRPSPTALARCACCGLQVNNAELWYLDVDKAALDAAPTPNTILLPKEDDAAAAEGRLAPAELQRIVGRAASDAGGRGNINAGTDGAVTFVLAPAAAAPGGAATVLQIVAALRAAGHFTVAAVTQPFAFEGHAKHEQVRVCCPPAVAVWGAQCVAQPCRLAVGGMPPQAWYAHSWLPDLLHAPVAAGPSAAAGAGGGAGGGAAADGAHGGCDGTRCADAGLWRLAGGPGR